EIDQAVEPLLTSGVAAFERGNTAQAHKDLSEVLRIDPQNTTAQGYLDRLGETVAPSGAPARSNPYVAPSVLDDDNLELGFFDEPRPEGSEAPLVPPSPGTEPSAAPR